MGIINLYKNYINDKVQCREGQERMRTWIKNYDAQILNNAIYIDPLSMNKMIKTASKIADELREKNVKYRFAPYYRAFNGTLTEFNECVSSSDEKLKIHNMNYVNILMPVAKSAIGKTEGYELDNQQMGCILKDAYNGLVIAGAGTGKTTTILGKVKYLINMNQCSPKQMLVLSFTNASANEMKARLKKEVNADIDVMTFHKLGLNIIRNVTGKTPKITNMELLPFVKKTVMKVMDDKNYMHSVVEYFLYMRKTEVSERTFSRFEAYKKQLMYSPPVTLAGELVHSYGEVDIANFLYINRIPYEYKPLYPFSCSLPTREAPDYKYYPSFHIKNSDIYIEYFGMNADNRAPKYFLGKDVPAGMTYRDNVRMRKNFHKSNGTKMIECTAYEKINNTMLQVLAAQLKASGISLSPMSDGKIWEILNNQESNLFEGLVKLQETIINQMKARELYPAGLLKLVKMSPSNYYANSEIAALTIPVYEAYQTALKENNEIDFNDMINLATKYVKEKKFTHSYKYVIIDEYQDISRGRYELLRAMRCNKAYKIFCVGDDWQSIYRFTGSNVDFILNFEKYWGIHEESKIETTYRFSQMLSDISSRFISNNPNQKKKQINGVTGDFNAVEEICGSSESDSILAMCDVMCNLPKNSSIFLIGRYSFDVQTLDECEHISYDHTNTSGLVEVFHKFRPDLKITFLTAHKSKGLQADYVFIINNKDSVTGFPSKIEDAPLLNLLLETSDTYPYAEERRLFYVALTRAKQKVYLVTVTGRKSIFAKEIEESKEFVRDENYICPLCGGNLETKKGPYGLFLGCSNYYNPEIRCEYTRTLKPSPTPPSSSKHDDSKETTEKNTSEEKK